MGARLRLKSSVVGGQDPVLRSADPQMRKIFRAMQRHGLIVADNGSDLYVSGTFDTRWNNDILNPAFAPAERVSDFEVVQLGWNPVGAPPTLAGLTAPARLVGGQSASARVTLSAAAGPGGAVVALSSSSPGVLQVPASVSVAEGQTGADFTITSARPTRARTVTLGASWQGKTVSAAVQVTRR
jgi:hypothetical protein